MSNRITDGNMEQAGTAAWGEYPDPNVTLSKDPTVKHSGTQSLKVDLTGFADPQYADFGQPDALIRTMPYLYQGGSSMPNQAWLNLLPDPGCQLKDAATWSAQNNATLTKETGDIYAPLVLRVAYNGTLNPGAYVAVFESGKTYRVIVTAISSNSEILTGPIGSLTSRWSGGPGNVNFTFTAAADGVLVLRHTSTGYSDFVRAGVYDITAGPSDPVLFPAGTVYGEQKKVFSDLGPSIQLTGESDYIDIGDRIFFPNDDQVSYLAFCFLRTENENGVIHSQWSAPSDDRFWFGLSNGRLKWTKPGRGFSVTGTTRIDDGRPHFIGWQKEPDQKISLWVDGQQDAIKDSDTWGFADTNTQIGISPLSGLDSLPCDLSISAIAVANWDQTFWQNANDALKSLSTTHAYAFQDLSDPTTDPIQFNGFAWADGLGGVPVLSAIAPDWTDPEIIWFGSDQAGEQTVQANMLDGLSSFTLGVKFSTGGFSNFDDFSTTDPTQPSDSLTKMKNVLMALLPPGQAWTPDPNRDFYKFIDGLGDGADAIYLDLKALEYIRDPERTQQLADLEKDYGIITNLDISEDDRRAQLKILRYVRDLTGSDDNLEDRLQEAGFNLKVFRNDPKIDPAVLMCDELVVNGDIFTQRPAYEMQCNGSIAYAGNQKAVCGYFVSMDRTAREYEIPTDPGLWGYFFFVCGDRQPAAEQNIIDGDMELAGVTNWPAGPSSATSKDTTLKQAGDQSLKVEAVSNTDPQVLTFGQPFGSTMSILQSFDGTSEIPELAWKNLLTDGTMSKPGPSAPDWLPLNNALNQKFQNTPLVGTIQHLRVFDQGTRNPAGYQLVFEDGKTYRVIGYGRGNGGSGVPQVETGPTGGPTVRWTGTGAFSWQPFDFAFTASADGALILRANTTALGELAYFVLVGVYDITDGPSDPVYHDPATLAGGHLLVADIGPALLLDGPAGDYIDQNDQNLPSQYNWSAGQVAIWIRTTATDGVIHSQWLEGDPDSYIFYLEDGKLTWEKPARGLKLQSNTTVNDGLAHRLIWQKSAITGQLKLYIDDQEDTPTTVTDFFPFANTTSRIGIQPGTPYEGAKFTLIACVIFDGYFFNLATAQSTWASFLDTRDNGSYSEQLIAPDILEARPIKGYAWGDGQGAIPAVYTRDPGSGDWQALWFGVDKTGRQVFNVECPSTGLDGIRLYTKFVEDGHCNFDEIDIRNLDFTSGTVPLELKEKLKRIILAYKPTRSWGCLLVNYA